MEELVPSDTSEREAGDGGRSSRTISAPSSPEFEFWVVRNPSLPPAHLLSADELFVDGVMLPLQLLHPNHNDPANEAPPPEPPEPGEPTPPELDQLASLAPSTAKGPSPAAISSAPISASKRWKDIFRGPAAAGEKKTKEREERRRSKERKVRTGGAPELNINIWPFSRSRSAGNGSSSIGASRQRHFATAGGRKVSSAPCSRSNSRGESSSSKPASAAGGSVRRWANSPGRTGAVGIHLGRASPVWQLRKGSRKVAEGKDGGAGGGRRKGRAGSTGAGGGSGVGIKAVSLNVNTCIGYGNHVSCRDEDGSAVTSSDRSGRVGFGGGHGIGSHFNLRALFSKKVY